MDVKYVCALCVRLHGKCHLGVSYCHPLDDLLNHVHFKVVKITGYTMELSWNNSKPGEHYAEWNKPVRERQIPYDFTHVESNEQIELIRKMGTDS